LGDLFLITSFGRLKEVTRLLGDPSDLYLYLDPNKKKTPNPMLHISLHFLTPALITLIFFKKNWLLAYPIMIATMLVDLDHLIATPIYDPNRCSIGFHPLHQLSFIAAYALLCLPPKTRLIGIGLIIHMALDSIDCQVTNGLWINE
jgi:hypothetical protein